MGWLVDKLRNGRVALAIKELKYDIDHADEPRRAKILFKAQEYRGVALEKAGVPLAVLDNPQNYPREFVMNIVTQLEEVIIEGQRQTKHAISHAKSIGMNGRSLEDEMRFEKRGVQVWIASLGATDKHVDDVKMIWSNLSRSIGSLSVVYDDLKARAYLTARLNSDNPSLPDYQVFIEACSFVPARYQPATTGWVR